MEAPYVSECEFSKTCSKYSCLASACQLLRILQNTPRPLSRDPPPRGWQSIPVPTASTSRTPKSDVDVFRYRDYRSFLAAFYAAGKAGGLSYRSFSRAAGLGGPNYLKLVIDGQRNLSLEMAARFAKACRLEGQAAEYFKLLVAFDQAADDDQRNALHDELMKLTRFRATHRLEVAQTEYHSRWYIPAVRELVGCPAFVDDPAWIVRVLMPPISEKEAGHALAVLEGLMLVERDERGKLRQANRAVTTGPQPTGWQVRNYHAEMMRGAVRAMQELPPEERYVAGLTLSGSARTAARVRQRIIDFRQELIALCDADPEGARVFQVGFQMFPLTEPLSRRRTTKDELEVSE